MSIDGWLARVKHLQRFGTTDGDFFDATFSRGLQLIHQITPLIITYNEASNIGRTLDKLRWAERIVVVDSGSTDNTITILRRYPKVEIVQHPFVDFASQCNFGLTQVASPWVLSLDADYELSDELMNELESMWLGDGPVGYQAHFVYRIHGRPLRGSLYPPRTVLYRKDGAFYRNDGHGHRVVVAGDIEQLRGIIFHDDRKPLSRWLASQRRYASDEAEYLLGSRRDRLGSIDKIRLMGWPSPIGVFLYVLFIKWCILDGWPGWYYVLQRVLAETLLALEIVDRRLAPKTPPGCEQLEDIE